MTPLGPGSDGREAPDSMDRVRNLNLSPVLPRDPGSSNTGVGGGQALEVFGSATGRTEVLAPYEGAAGAEGGIELNFENTPISTVAKVVLGDTLKVGYVLDPRVQGNVSLSSGRPVPKAKLLYALESALRAGNFALVRNASGYLITPASEAIGSGAVDTPGQVEPGYGVTIIPLRYVSAQNVSKLLEGFAVRAGAVRPDPSGNMLVVTGTGAERRSALDTVRNFDADWMRGQSVGVYPVQNSVADAMIPELEKIFDSAEGGRGQGLAKFQSIGRMNAILVVARKPDVLRNAANWISRLDHSQSAANGVKVYQARYADARNLAKLLTDIFGGGSGGGLDSAASQIAPSAGQSTLTPTERLTGGGTLAQQMTQAFGGAGGAGGGGGGSASPFGSLRSPSAAGGASGGASGGGSDALGSGRGGGGASTILPGVRIAADTANNSVLVYSSLEQFKMIEKALRQLDRPQRQVAVDLTIAEVTLNDTLNNGVQFFLSSSDIGLKADTGSLVNTAASAVLAQALPGFNFLAGSQLQPRLIINALHSYTDVKVLSNPSLVVVDNQTATLQVGDQVPVSTGSATVLNANNSVVNTIDYKNTGIILRISPRINSNGSVVLDVEQEISNVANNTGGAQTLTPTLTQRRVKSTIMVTSGQTVLLAGLISDSQTRGRGGIPVLDQIPYIGDVFSQNQKTAIRTELIIFIRPQIIRDSVDASVIAEELRSKLRGSKGASFVPVGAVSPLTPRIVH